MTSTSSPRDPSIDDGPGTDDEPARPRRVAMIVTLVAVLALVIGWLYILFGYDPGLMIDELPDTAFPDRAEQVCAAARDELDLLPSAQNAAGAQDRAETVARSNIILAAMIADLEPLVVLVPAEPARYREGTQAWLDDWSTYLGNRERYVENLREDPEARFLETSKGAPTKGITRAINGFAQVNEMTSCQTPGDLS